MINQPIRFATFLAPNMFPVYRFVADYVADKLKHPTQLSVGASFEQFAAGELDVGFICGLPYVQLTARPEPPVELLAAPVIEGERYGGKPVYFSDVIVRHESHVQSFADLCGCSWCYNDPGSHSGYNAVRYWLAKHGERSGYFGKVIQAGFHQHSIQLVCAGEIDASAIDSQVLTIEMREHPELSSQLRIIDKIGPSSIQPVVAARPLPESLKSELRAVLLEMGDDPIAKEPLAHGFVARFAAVTDATYDDIRGMLAIAESVKFA